MTARPPESAPGRVPDLLVEQLALGELSPHRAAEVRARLQAEPDGLARLEALVASDAAVRAALPPEAVLPAARAHAALEGPLGRRGALGGLVGGLTGGPMGGLRPLPALAAALVGLLALGVAFQGAVQPPPAPGDLVPGVRTKGLAPALHVYLLDGASVRALDDGDAVAPGARLQLGLVARPDTHAVLLSVDGRGLVTRHFPEPGGTTEVTDGETLLGRSYQLDDAPAHETFLLFTDPTPLDPATLETLLRARGADGALTAPLELGDGRRLRPKAIRLRKVAPP